MEKLKTGFWIGFGIVFLLSVVLNLKIYVWTPIQQGIYAKGANDTLVSVINQVKTSGEVRITINQKGIVLVPKDPNEVRNGG